jgi:hypothetical protein
MSQSLKTSRASSRCSAARPLAARLAHAATDDQLRGFQQGLKQVGFVEGENVSILYRSAENEIEAIAGSRCRSGSPTGRSYRNPRSCCGVRG